MQVRVALRVAQEPGLRADELAALAAAVERQPGVDLLWVARATPGEGALLQSCAAAAASTSHLGIAAAGLALPCHHTIRFAEDLATLDGLAGGRLEVLLQLRPGGSERSEEEIALVRRAWAGEPLDRPNASASLADLGVHPRPVRPGGPPLWIEAPTVDPEPAVQLAVRLGAGLAAQKPEQVRSFLRAWRAAARGEAAVRLAISVARPLALRGLRPRGRENGASQPPLEPSEARAELESRCRALNPDFDGELVGIFDLPSPRRQL